MGGVQKIVVRGSHEYLDVQLDAALRSTVAIHGNLIGCAREAWEQRPAGSELAAKRVSIPPAKRVTGHTRQVGDRIALINCQNCVKRTPSRGHGSVAGHRGRPSPPDRAASRVTSMVWFARLLGRAQVPPGGGRVRL